MRTRRRERGTLCDRGSARRRGPGAACSRTRSSGSSGARRGHELRRARRARAPRSRARAARRGGAPRSGLRSAASAAATSGLPAPRPSPSSRSRAACGRGSRRISSASSIRPHPSTCGSSVEPLAERVVADRGERDRGVERELLVAADDAEQVGVLAAAEPAHQGHRVLDLVAVPRAQEDLAQLGIEAVGVRGRIGAQAIAQRVDPAAHVALAEELAHAPVAARGRLRRERHERARRSARPPRPRLAAGGRPGAGDDLAASSGSSAPPSARPATPGRT